MILLSQLIDRQHCGAAETEVLDDVLAFGRFLTAPDVTQPKLATLAEWVDAGTRFQNLVGFLGPSQTAGIAETFRVYGLEVFNDLYRPGFRKEDGIYTICIPVTGSPRSTEGVTTDFAFLLLAAAATRQEEPDRESVIIEAWWPDGTVVRGAPDKKVWEALKYAVKGSQLENRNRVTGPACHRCLNQKGCRSWESLDEVLALAPTDRGQAKTEAHRLWLEWVLLRDLETKVESRRKAVAKRLQELAVEGIVDVGGLLKLNVQSSERKTYEPLQVFELLWAAGLWSWDLVAVKVGELHKLMEKFPPAVRSQLERMAKKEKTEPSIREAAAGTQRSVHGLQTSPFVGFHLRG